MRHIDLSASFRRVVIASAMLLAACGSGGGGSDVIPPFWIQAGVVVADFNGDNRADVAVATTYIAGGPPHPGHVDVYLQTPSGTFDAPAQYVVGPDAWGLSAGDFDGDGKLDLDGDTRAYIVVANAGDGRAAPVAPA
jgi:hypothetical protein